MSGNLHEMSLQELELRIRLADSALRWLRSDDPMLQDEQYRELVAPTIERVRGECKELVEARAKLVLSAVEGKMQQPEPVVVGLKSAKVKTKVGGF